MLYKCGIQSGGNQWFVSIVEEGSEPGTSNDIDFYYALAESRPGHIYGRIVPPLKLSVMKSR